MTSVTFGGLTAIECERILNPVEIDFLLNGDTEFPSGFARWVDLKVSSGMLAEIFDLCNNAQRKRVYAIVVSIKGAKEADKWLKQAEWRK